MTKLRRPKQAGKSCINRSREKIFEIVQITVKNEGIGSGKRSEISDLGKGSLAAECLQHDAAIKHSEKMVILFSVHTRRKAGAIGEGPASGKIASVAFVKLKSGDSFVTEFFMISGEALRSLIKRKIRHKTSPHKIIAGIRNQIIVKRRRRICKSMLPKIYLETV